MGAEAGARVGEGAGVSAGARQECAGARVGAGEGSRGREGWIKNRSRSRAREMVGVKVEEGAVARVGAEAGAGARSRGKVRAGIRAGAGTGREIRHE